MLNDDEKILFDKILSELPKEIGEAYYIKLIGEETTEGGKPKRFTKKHGIPKLIDADWPEDMKEELIRMYALAKKYSKPAGGYIHKISYDAPLDIGDIITKLENKGFIVEPCNGKSLKFKYKKIRQEAKFDEDGKVNYVTYPIYLHYELDLDNNILEINNMQMAHYGPAKSAVKYKLPFIKINSVIAETPDPVEVNEKLKRFIEDLKTVVVVNNIIREMESNTTCNFDRYELLGEIEPYKTCIERLKTDDDSFNTCLPLMIPSKCRDKSKYQNIQDIENLRIPPTAGIRTLVIKEVYLDIQDLDVEMIEEDEIIELNGKKQNLREYVCNTGFDDFKKMELEGDDDIFENNTVKICVKAGGRIAGVGGKLLYDGANYEFTVKHGINMRGIRPDIFKINYPGDSLITDKNKHDELIKVKNRLITIYKNVFLK